MRSYKKVMPFLLSALLLVSAGLSVKMKMDKKAEYSEALAAARNLADKGIEADAIEKYKEAIELEPSLELVLEAGEVYLQNENLSAAKKWYQNQLLESYPRDAETYLYGIQVYLAQGNYRSAFSVYDNYQGRGLYLKSVEDEIDRIRYKYTLSGQYDDVGVFSNITNTAPVLYNELWGYVDAQGNRKITYDYTSAGTFGEYAPVTDGDGNAMYIDQTGAAKINENFILENDPDFGHITAFQGIQSHLILAYNGEFWNYYNDASFEKEFGGYQDAKPITLGVGAVSEDGNKWALISADGQLRTGFVYDEVLSDQKGVICRTEAIVVKQDGKYFLVDSEGNQIGTETFAKASAFYDDTYAAMGTGRNWSFLDDKGNTILTGSYQDARSFSNGLAAVKQDGKWGYIDTLGELVIPCEFEEAGPFNATGVAFVKKSSGSWTLLSLYQYNHD